MASMNQHLDTANHLPKTMSHELAACAAQLSRWQFARRRSARKHLAVFTALNLALGLLISGTAVAQENDGADSGTLSAIADVPSESQSEREFVLLQIRDLGNASYRARQIARWRLEQHPLETLAAISEVIDDVDHNTGAQLIDLLGVLATHADITVSLRSRELLDDTSQQLTYAGNLAANVMQAIDDVQETQAVQKLTLHGALIGSRRIRLHNVDRLISAPEPVVLEINPNFDGNPEAIEWIRCLKSVDTVFVDSVPLDRKMLESICQLEQLRNLKLRHVTLDANDLKLFRALTNLEYLEIAYTDIDDSALDILAGLPVSQYVRLYGTQVTKQGAIWLAKQLDSVEIYRGNGGFLGVGTLTTNTIVTLCVPGSGADKAGIRTGDKLTRVEAVAIENFDELRRELGKFDAGDTVEVGLERKLPNGNDFPMTVQVVLGEEPSN